MAASDGYITAPDGHITAPDGQMRRGGTAAGYGVQDVGLDQALIGSVLPEERRRSRRWARPERYRDAGAPLSVLSRELARSRRYRRPFALIGIIPASRMRRESAVVAAAVGLLVRTVDSVWASTAGAFILLPECDRNDANALLARLRVEAADVIGQAATQIAVFPEDALTTGALLEIAGGRVEGPLSEPVESPRGAGVQPVAAGRLVPADPPTL